MNQSQTLQSELPGEFIPEELCGYTILMRLTGMDPDMDIGGKATILIRRWWTK
ncbi:MAG: hypothetical protein ACYS80_27225 [Planctomycetota bacterium]